ncbi:MAG: hypothetical protein A3B74_01910 [Candidatus Kerfeldbacteria bacterium RIFCSPHIGHO2_02_FULL_42_14]|uniref:Glycosyl transferase family 1 domain-containing protein n=1 Tax=Candidatus Kerfeldbacteria bacterium RIFCSPHIGHO2_02_FULL_42_14 TaxID=1798540 RepID=A0A1G2ANE6_9BACT|nr:MAG: hypothetical protein A3B74_01910 [Candidatus Kerfeldbacteria bacterium RIFCSPHIGHO2_02_FULL_42_14]
MKRVLIYKFPYSSLFGGGERHTLDLVEGLQTHGFEFFLVSSCSVLVPEFRRRQISTWRLPFIKEPVSYGTVFLFPFVALFAFCILSSILIYFRIGYRVQTLYCLSLTEKILITPVARLLGMRVLWIEHVACGRWLVLNPFRPLYVAFSRLASIVTPSQDAAHSFIQLGVLQKRIHVIPYGLRIDAWTVERKHLPDPTKHFTLGYVGRLEPEKGVDILLRAIQEVRFSLPHIRGIIIGHGSSRRHLEWLAREFGILDRVTFVGFQLDVQKWLKNLHVLILPSVKRESFGIIVLEALCAKVPVIASDIGGVPEIIEHNKTGYLVHPGNVEALVEQILFTYHHYTDALESARRGSAKVAAQFSLETMLSRFSILL